MTKPRITIVGLGLIGNSIGMALSQGKRDFEIVGHDRESAAAGLARKMTAVDKTDWNLLNACEGADLVILALPVQAVRKTLEALANELKPGCVVMDTASIKVPVLEWAEEILPDTVHFIGTNPIVSSDESGGQAARADLFENTTWAICSSASSHQSAVRMAADLAERLGSKPLFLDAIEHDGMLAAVEHLPAVLSATLVASVTSQPSWREMRKLAGGQFEVTTRLASADPEVLRDAALSNRDNLTRWIDNYIEHLQAWRDVIAANDEEALEERFVSTQEARQTWQKERRLGYWDEGQPEMPEKPGMLTSLLGFRRPRRPDAGTKRR